MRRGKVAKKGQRVVDWMQPPGRPGAILPDHELIVVYSPNSRTQEKREKHLSDVEAFDAWLGKPRQRDVIIHGVYYTLNERSRLVSERNTKVMHDWIKKRIKHINKHVETYGDNEAELYKALEDEFIEEFGERDHESYFETVLASEIKKSTKTESKKKKPRATLSGVKESRLSIGNRLMWKHSKDVGLGGPKELSARVKSSDTKTLKKLLNRDPQSIEGNSPAALQQRAIRHELMKRGELVESRLLRKKRL